MVIHAKKVFRQLGLNELTIFGQTISRKAIERQYKSWDRYE